MKNKYSLVAAVFYHYGRWELANLLSRSIKMAVHCG